MTPCFALCGIQSCSKRTVAECAAATIITWSLNKSTAGALHALRASSCISGCILIHTCPGLVQRQVCTAGYTSKSLMRSDPVSGLLIGRSHRWHCHACADTQRTDAAAHSQNPMPMSKVRSPRRSALCAWRKQVQLAPVLGSSPSGCQASRAASSAQNCSARCSTTASPCQLSQRRVTCQCDGQIESCTLLRTRRNSLRLE